MNKVKVLNEIENCGIVAVVRGNSKDVGIKISEACIRGNIKIIEVTYTNKFASDIIKDLDAKYSRYKDVVIGAGTVLDSETAMIAILSGAKFIVSPSFSEETARLCNRYRVPYMPGVMTINEIIKAYELGADIVKVFPGNVLGREFVSSVKGPLPYASIMVTGGVNLDNIELWKKSGVDVIGIGGEINKLGVNGKFDEITELCTKYVKKFNEVR
ncbi:2-dehydro-3-deoxyphosphogluconate aldolase/4-hydroxy-2-oxoglutarate aldolase family protein [Clostridium sporogenes]|uniref:2-dehydro-3-deoxyphosphogluconate aldolase/4-hydroxy-2-oxoglutarate aldolase family protein n=1 Tax=Clostridium sporogenes TaxID=1509 RepID=A0A1L3NIT9_CLOSG|nr:bifunctional 2-keto-4-hydroxyglutarate aldolase/2-keto-3-deoxy-6-phosphogluconate aldolase [Clostridium sporogenes]APH16003.1 2-dehydro-3-deoxyphosphogluconate aldolase/4-hydroxy-2-oxoglutarate aldolase family protein [Clostridium sporogenes]